MSAPKHKTSPQKRSDKAPTERVIGQKAVAAVLHKRPRDVLHIAHTRDARFEVAELLREAAKQRIAYREVERDELERMADTVHHEGVCMLAKAKKPVSVQELAQAVAKGGFVIALDRVDNPHNVGALLRSAAYFGARGMLIAAERERALTPAAVRVAEGGAEHVPVCVVPELPDALDRLIEAGAQVVGADAHRGEALPSFRWAAKTVLVLGSERSGLTAPVKKRCHGFVHIEGTSAVESLNVSVAAGILMAAAAQGSKSKA